MKNILNPWLSCIIFLLQIKYDFNKIRLVKMHIYKKSATYLVTLLNKICSGNEN